MLVTSGGNKGRAGSSGRPPSPVALTLPEDREQARRIATNVVAIAIAIVGLTLLVFSVVLVLRGGMGFLFLGIVLFLLGAALAALGFFFQLVPFRLQELADEKRAHDQRERAGKP